MSKKYFISGGGTGGHIYPAVAVADALLEKEDCEIYFIGNPKNLEFTITKDKNYTFLPVDIKGMPRKCSIRFIFWLFQLLVAVVKCYFYLLKYKPNAIFGTGGYVSAPILIASILNNSVPFVMHDSDAQPGLVTKYLSPYASSVSLAFEKAKQYIKNENISVNGNPLRPRFKTLSKEIAKNGMGLDKSRPVLLVMGGSQGAKSIDNAFVEIIRELSTINNLQIIFQTGAKNYSGVIERLEKIYPTYLNDTNLNIKPYFEDMITVLKASDIVISRAGSLSLSEIFASEVAPILIPYPYAAADHQRKNAKSVEEKDACVYLEDSETDANSLKDIINKLLSDSQLTGKLTKKSSELAIYDGLERIVNQIWEVQG